MIGTDVSLADRDRIAAQCSISAPRFAFINGAAGDESAHVRNRQAWRGVQVKHHHPIDVSSRDLSGQMFGKKAAMPVGIAPFGLANSVRPGTDAMLVTAAKKAGIPVVISTFASTDIAALKSIGADMAFQLYWRPTTAEQDTLLAHVTSTAADGGGVTSVIVTVDTPIRAGSDQEAVTDFAPDISPAMTENTNIATDVTVAKIEALAEKLDAQTPKVSVYVKGALSPVVVKKLAETKVKGVIISNHSGRQLDSAPSTVDAFLDVKANTTIPATFERYIDSGIRTGWDVLRALSLGAQGCLIGRQALYAVAAGGQARLDEYLARVREELDTAMASSGSTATTNVPGTQPTTR